MKCIKEATNCIRTNETRLYDEIVRIVKQPECIRCIHYLLYVREENVVGCDGMSWVSAVLEFLDIRFETLYIHDNTHDDV